MSSTFGKLIVALDRKAAKDSVETPKFLEQFTQNICLQNLLENGDFQEWTAGDLVAPDGWTLVNGAIAKESTTVYINSYSAQLTRSGADAILSQNIAGTRGISYFKGRKVTISGWCSGVSNVAVIRVFDGVNTTNSVATSTVTGTWSFIDVTHTVNAAATELTVSIVALADAIAYWDGLMAVEGELAFAFTPQAAGGGGGPSTDTLDNVCDRGAVTDQSITAAGFTTTGSSNLGVTDIDELTINGAFTLPTADGTVGQILKTDGAGNVGWESLSGADLYYTTVFTNANLVAGILTVNHALNGMCLHVSVIDSLGKRIIPTNVTDITANSINVDLTGFAPISGTWRVRVSV
jgi:hypothetical protein